MYAVLIKLNQPNPSKNRKVLRYYRAPRLGSDDENTVYR